MHTDDRHHAYLALRATLHALREPARPGKCGSLQRPTADARARPVLRGLAPGRETHQRADPRRFLSTIYGASCPRARGIDPDLAARAVFGVLWEKLDVGEIGNVIDRLPADLQELWR
jgi:uncharacterized protein (DUF2267 family)